MALTSLLRGSLQRGAVAGVIGTAAMTALGMKPGAARWLPESMLPDEFLPLKITRWVEQKARLYRRVKRTGSEAALTGASHLGYGALAGAGYGLLRSRLDRLPSWLAGGSYGVILWAAGYEGWIPAAGIQPPTTQKPPRKWTVPVGSHLIFGLATALAFERLKSL